MYKLLEIDELEKAVKRHERRRKVFVEEGLSEDEAWDLAEKMFDRDLDPMDDRRICFECAKLERNKYCTFYRDADGKPRLALRFILKRCAGFKLKEVRK